MGRGYVYNVCPEGMSVLPQRGYVPKSMSVLPREGYVPGACRMQVRVCNFMQGRKLRIFTPFHVPPRPKILCKKPWLCQILKTSM